MIIFIEKAYFFVYTVLLWGRNIWKSFSVFSQICITIIYAEKRNTKRPAQNRWNALHSLGVPTVILVLRSLCCENKITNIFVCFHTAETHRRALKFRNNEYQMRFNWYALYCLELHNLINNFNKHAKNLLIWIGGYPNATLLFITKYLMNFIWIII